MTTDWRLPENRREAFQRMYSLHLKYKSHPGCVYSLLPAIAEAYDLDPMGREWLVWLNGNTQNPAMSLLLLEASNGSPAFWRQAVDFWNDNFKMLDWDTDRRHQKSKFGEATEKWWEGYAEGDWQVAGALGWDEVWKYAFNQPYMGRLSAWSMTEYARILLPGIPDAAHFMLHDVSGSCSHRNGTATVKGYDAVYWEPEAPFLLGIVPELEAYAEDLLAEAQERNPGHPDVSRLTMESALCTFKSWFKENRRYPNVYADMAYNRIKKAEARFGPRFQVLWQARSKDLPWYLRLESVPYDPGLVPVKQNWFRKHGTIHTMYRDWPEIGPTEFDEKVASGAYGVRKDPRWV